MSFFKKYNPHVPEHPSHPDWNWDEHGHQLFQRVETAEKRVEILMVVVALLIILAIGARLMGAYNGLPV
jgi:hypothetical protein